MTVYAEYAFLQNVLLDGLLLYLALKCARGRVGPVRLLLTSCVGGAEALLFPFLSVPTWCAYLIKILGGVLLAVLAVSKGNKKTYLITVAVFFFLTFALGGLLVAAYTFFGVEYIAGEGYLIERAPVTLIFCLAGIFTILVSKGAAYLYRYRRIQTGVCSCTLHFREREITLKALADSGNLLTYSGSPVCVISPIAALALFRGDEPVGRMTVSTVNGSRSSPVYLLGMLRVRVGREEKTHRGVYVTVGAVTAKDYKMILHTAFLEGRYEDFSTLEGVAFKK